MTQKVIKNRLLVLNSHEFLAECMFMPNDDIGRFFMLLFAQSHYGALSAEEFDYLAGSSAEKLRTKFHKKEDGSLEFPNLNHILEPLFNEGTHTAKK